MPADFIIVSGTSGSGKTIALQVLEDLGFYCVDNLPASMIAQMGAAAAKGDPEGQRCAISIDSRNRDFSQQLSEHFEELHSLDIEYRIIFLDADERTLLQRYSETRRKHPLSDDQTSLVEAIEMERSMLEPISRLADHHINTSSTTPHELRSQIRNYAASSEEKSLTLLFQSFGFKYGPPTDADFVFDVRCLPNPHWKEELQPLTGLDSEVHDYLQSKPECGQMFTDIRDFIAGWLPSFIADNRNYLTVAIGCTGGKHRSVYLCAKLREHFGNDNAARQMGLITQIRHRELNL